MAIVQRTKIGEYTLEIETDPAGYSEGTWGYIVRNSIDDVWFDGGFESREHAYEDGRALIARLDT